MALHWLLTIYKAFSGLPNRRLVNCQTGHVTDSTKLQHPQVVQPTGWLVCELTRPLAVQSMSRPVCELTSSRFGNPRVGVSASCPVTSGKNVLMKLNVIYAYGSFWTTIQKQYVTVNSTVQNVASALVFYRVDYCNSSLAGLPAGALVPLQWVLNAATRFVADLRPRDHVTSVQRSLHWLPICQCI